MKLKPFVYWHYEKHDFLQWIQIEQLLFPEEKDKRHSKGNYKLINYSFTQAGIKRIF